MNARSGCFLIRGVQRNLTRGLVYRILPLLTGLVLIGWLRPPALPTAFTGPHTVQAVHDHVCVHTRLIDEVETWKIQESLALVRTLGASTVVELFPWAYIEPQRGQYNWAQTDRIVRHAVDQGVRVIARLGLVPAWARQPTPDEPATTLNTLPDDSFEAFAAFAGAFAQRYRAEIQHIIVWNEPNLAFEWGYQPVDPARYVRLLAATAPAIRAANPDAVILAGALAPTLEPVGSPHGLDDLLYLTALYEQGAAEFFDALAVHTYGFTESALVDPAPDQLNFRRVELLRAIMEQHGDAASPIHITESGWNDDPRWTKAVTPSRRIEYTLQALEWAADHAWVQSLCLWLFRTPAPVYAYPDHFALVTPEFYLRPIYYAVQNYARGYPNEGALWLPAPG